MLLPSKRGGTELAYKCYSLKNDTHMTNLGKSIGAARRDLQDAIRRRHWIFGALDADKILNLMQNAFGFVFSREHAGRVPSVVKIDISPLCTLRCPTCVHADASAISRPLLEAQSFRKSDVMHVDQFTRIIDQIRGKALAVSLFYYGDPLTNPRVDEMCGIARRAGLSVHITTHFSYDLSDTRIERIAKSGLTHLTVAIDGATQESYATTRIGGRLDWVMSNLQRLASYKQEHGLKHPIIEVQHIKHPHHAADEEENVKARSFIPGVNSFTSFVGVRYDKDGALFNIVDADLSAFTFGKPKTRSILPKCHWPFSAMVVKSNGDVIACCMHREARQHTNLPGQAVLGNVFTQTISKIWNGTEYQKIRRLAADPARSVSDAALRESYCYGCARLITRVPVTTKPQFPVPVVTVRD